MRLSKRWSLKTGLLIFAAFSFVFTASSGAEPLKKTAPKGAKRTTEKRSKSAEFIILQPTDSKLITLFGFGYQTPIYNNIDLRVELSWGSKSASTTVLDPTGALVPGTATITSIPFVVAGRYPFLRGGKYLLFGEGGYEYNMLTSTYQSQSTYAAGLILGAGGNYYFGNGMFGTAALRLHTASVSGTTPGSSLIVGLGMTF